MPGWLAVPRDWLASLGEIARFSGRVMGIVYAGRVMRFFGGSGWTQLKLSDKTVMALNP